MNSEEEQRKVKEKARVRKREWRAKNPGHKAADSLRHAKTSAAKRVPLVAKKAAATAGRRPSTIQEGVDIARAKAEARVLQAQLECTLTNVISRAGYYVIRADAHIESLKDELLGSLPVIDSKEFNKWGAIFNTVRGDRRQKLLWSQSAKGRYGGAKEVVEGKLIPYINQTLFGNGDREVQKPSLLLSRRTTEALAKTQGAHRDWEREQ